MAQSAAFAAALARIGCPPVRMERPDGAGMVSLLRRDFGPLRVGLLSRVDLSRPALRDLAHRAQVRLLILNPESAAGAHGFALQTPAHVVEWGITAPETMLRARLKQKWRNRLAKAERAALRVKVTEFNAACNHWLLEQEAHQARRRGYANWPEPLTRAFAAANPGQAQIFEACQGAQPVAAMMSLRHGRVATYHLGWTSPTGRALCAHHLLLWDAMRYLRGHGIARLDLGTVATDCAPGLARFKLGTGAAPRQLGGTWAAFC